MSRDKAPWKHGLKSTLTSQPQCPRAEAQNPGKCALPMGEGREDHHSIPKIEVGGGSPGGGSWHPTGSLTATRSAI